MTALATLRKTAAVPVVCGLAALMTAAAPLKPPPTQRNFIACPIVLDTEDIPCWVAEYKGERYFLAMQTGRGRVVYVPQLKHRVLVEGTIDAGPRVCGGVPLKDVSLSVMPEVEPNCGKLLPGGQYHTVGTRPVGPDVSYKLTSIRTGAGTGSGGDDYVPPVDHPSTVIPPKTVPEDSAAWRKAKYVKASVTRETLTFPFYYFFNSNYLEYPVAQDSVQEAAEYAQMIHATHVDVMAHRGETILSNGRRFDEQDGMGKMRAQKVGDILLQLGVPKSALTVEWSDTPQNQGGVKDYELRNVTITVSQ